MNQIFKLILISTCFTGNCFAGSMGASLPTPSWGIVGALSLGPAWINSNHANTLQLVTDPNITKLYTEGTRNTPGMGELFLGVYRPVGNAYIGELGIALTSTAKSKINGYVCDDSDCVNFTNQSYKAEIRYGSVALKGKLRAPNLTPYPGVEPFVTGTIGLGESKAKNFNLTPLICGVDPDPNFTAGSQRKLIYSGGLGVQVNLSNSVAASVTGVLGKQARYEFGAGQAQTTNDRLSGSSNYTAIMLALNAYLDSGNPTPLTSAIAPPAQTNNSIVTNSSFSDGFGRSQEAIDHAVANINAAVAAERVKQDANNIKPN